MMKNIIKPYLPFLFLLLWWPFQVFALQGPAADSLSAATSLQEHHYQVRQIQQESLQELQQEEGMDYHIASPEDNLWMMFRNWLFLQLMRLFGTEEAAGILEIIVYTLCIIALIYALLRIMKVDLSGLISSGNRRARLTAEGMEDTENLHQIDFQTAIAEAIKAQEYNKAVRLLYLLALRELTEEDLLHWQPGKTNYQYQQELKAAHLQDPFRQLGSFFEYAWYGNFAMNERHYQEAEKIYQSLHQILKQPA